MGGGDKKGGAGRTPEKTERRDYQKSDTPRPVRERIERTGDRVHGEKETGTGSGGPRDEGKK